MPGNNIRVIFSNKNYRFKTSSDLFHVLLLNLFSVLSTSVCWVSSCTHTFPRPFRWRASPSSGDPGHQWASPLPCPTASPTFPSFPCAGSLSSALHQLRNCHTGLPQISFCSSRDASYLCPGLHLPGNSAQTGPLLLALNLFLHFLPRAPADLSNIHQVLAEGCYSGMLCPYWYLSHLNIQFSSFLSYMYSFFQLGFGICKSGSQVF